jgi:endonuclease/exonuclease/phosphatase family metal-dependent hydrolase
MRIKVVSLNTWHGGRLFDNMIRFLQEQDADILMLQEVFNSDDPKLEPRFRCYTELQKILGYKYAHFAPALTFIQTEGAIVEGNAVLSKSPLTGHEPIFFNEPYRDDYTDTPENYPTCPRNLQQVEAATPVGPIHLLNLQGVWDLDGDNPSEKRYNMARIIIEQAKGKNRVIVAGDTNAKPTNKAMLTIEEHLHSVFKNELKTSFNIRRKDMEKFPGYGTAVVDLMYVSPDVKVLAKDCPNVDISDHLPLTVTLEIS